MERSSAAQSLFPAQPLAVVQWRLMKPLSKAVQEELAALAEMTDEDIDFSDIPETKDEDWVGAVRGKFYRPDTQFKFNED